MFDKLAQLFSAPQAATETDEQHLSQLAATALLIELCRADNSVDAVEIAEVISIAQSTFKLSEQAAEKLLEDAQQKSRQLLRQETTERQLSEIRQATFLHYS